MTNYDAISYIRHVLANARGDDLERAEHAFRNMITPQELNRKYRQSGKTFQEILDEYRADRKQWQEASDFFEQWVKQPR